VKVIAIEDGLEDLGEYLCYKGLTVVPLDHTAQHIDAIVYTEKKLVEIMGIPAVQMVDLESQEMYRAPLIGVLLVNVKNKTREQVYRIIKDRLYEQFI
jgi:uncharacterized protein (UPF0218 family)